MEFLDLIKNRYSVRTYRDIPVEPWKLEQVLEAGRLAPTSNNQQPFQILVVDTAIYRAELGRLYTREWFVQAPLVLGVCIQPKGAWLRRFDGVHYAYVDAAIVMDHMILGATALGLGTCWIAAFNPHVAREIFSLPDDWEPVIFSPLGYAADAPSLKERKPLDQLVRYIP
jgi:nitroreductase